MSRAERLLQLMQALRRQRVPVAGQALAQSLGISLRTLYRDIAALQEAEEATPHNIQRAENLLAYTRRLVANPHCQGVDKREAEAALHRAEQAVDKAREDGTAKHIQRAGAELALSAAKIARSCGRGQLSLTARATEEASKPKKPAPKNRRRKAPAKKPRTRKAAAAESTEEKDKALLGMFQAAITAALKEAA